MYNHHHDSISKFHFQHGLDKCKFDHAVFDTSLNELIVNNKLLTPLYYTHLSLIGQKPLIKKSKKSIANFKTRKGFAAGVKVTLRSTKMYEFIDRLVNIALPRIKDFRGLNSNGIDKFGNYTFGIKEHIIFPEVNFDKVDKIRGMDITVVTTSVSKEATLELLKEFNFPLTQTTKN